MFPSKIDEYLINPSGLTKNASTTNFASLHFSYFEYIWPIYCLLSGLQNMCSSGRKNDPILIIKQFVRLN